MVEDKKNLIDVYQIHAENVEIIDFLPRITGVDREGRIQVVLLYVGGNHFHRIISPYYEIYSSGAFSNSQESHEIVRKQLCEDLVKAIRNSKISFEKEMIIQGGGGGARSGVVHNEENQKDREGKDNERVSLQESMIIQGGGGEGGAASFIMKRIKKTVRVETKSFMSMMAMRIITMNQIELTLFTTVCLRETQRNYLMAFKLITG